MEEEKEFKDLTALIKGGYFITKPSKAVTRDDLDELMSQSWHTITLLESEALILMKKLCRIGVPLWTNQARYTPGIPDWEGINVSYFIPDSLLFIHAKESQLGKEKRSGLYEEFRPDHFFTLVKDKTVIEKYRLWKKKNCLTLPST